MKVCSTGIRNRRANDRPSSEARPRITPFPARITRRFDPAIAWIARVTCDDGGSDRIGAGTKSGSSARASSMVSSATSSGNSRWVAPSFSVCAILKAFRIASGITSNFGSDVFHLMAGLNNQHHVDVLVRFLAATVQRGLPADRDQRSSVKIGVRNPGRRFVEPGPKVDKYTPALPLSSPKTSDIDAAPCSGNLSKRHEQLFRRARHRMQLGSTEARRAEH